MTEEAKKIKEALNRTWVDKDALNQVCKDRLDFGFDSIYFRYAAIRDELTIYKVMYEKGNLQTEKQRANHDKMRFYQTLEQLVHAHDQEGENVH